jgi:hypothetical protein
MSSESQDAAVLSRYRRLGERDKQVFLEALERIRDGQPFEELVVERLVERDGISRDEAREQLRKAMERAGDQHSSAEEVS